MFLEDGLPGGAVIWTQRDESVRRLLLPRGAAAG